MLIDIRREDCDSLGEYATIPVAFEVWEALEVPASGALPSLRRRRPIKPSYRKDYDAISGNHPRNWPTRFAVDRACFLAAYTGTARVGGAVVIVESADVVRLGGELGFALLWDLRVGPSVRRRGVGRALLAAAEACARDARTYGIAVETQDINLAACHVYAAAGFAVTSVEPDAYGDLPEETRIVWRKTFEPRAPSA